MTDDEHRFIKTVHVLHNWLYDEHERYRKLISGTTATTEGTVWADELDALAIMRKVAATLRDDDDTPDGHAVTLDNVAGASTSELSDALHLVLTFFGLGGSRVAGKRHVMAVLIEQAGPQGPMWPCLDIARQTVR